MITAGYDKHTVQIMIIHLQKYKNIPIIHPTHQIKKLQKNTQMNYLHTLQITLFKKKNFKGNNNTRICQDYDEISEDSLLSSNESLQTINKNENNANHVEKNISGLYACRTLR